MKHKHIIIGILAVSLMAITFVSTATAAGALWYAANLTGARSGKTMVLTIDTTSAGTVPPTTPLTSFAGYVDITTIRVTYYNNKGVGTEVNPDDSVISVSSDGNSIVITLDRAAYGLPTHASAANVQGSLTGLYVGDTFLASGPGWGWANIHK